MDKTDAEDTGGVSSPTAMALWVADVLRDKIVKGAYPPGSRLVERKISAELELSRTPVREALKLLQADGLIGISRNKGAQVLQYGAEEALFLFEVIASLESLAAERLARTIASDTLDELEELHAKMLTYHKVGSIADYFDTNSDIHDFIVEHCGNPLILETHTRLIARARRGRFLAIMQPKRLDEALGEHEILMDALRGRDPALAAQIWRSHLLHTGETVAAALRDVAGE
ncbi:MAG: GntR family transcriptional regulator [Confluentimicrobium sp.]|uniref:GntR family transcriptional regulator n=1 Tax=Actibacterium sp. TaxID=1872125 RepID=UPI000C3D536D|nr:GntR family transcriptional regulator [Actibacterium sp.]MBC57553.1 GntR family transcriptional regulator [Actibacterium sp.]